MSETRRPNPTLTLFAHLLSMPEDEINVAEAALVFAETEYEDLEISFYTSVLDDLGAEAKRVVGARTSSAPEERIRTLIDWLYRSQDFRGNAEAYYDPRNSYLNQVLDRKRGIPISLALVLLEVAFRAGVPAEGISFPGHFLVRAGEADRSVIVDPFHGRILGQTELEALASREPQGKDPRKLQPCGKRMLLFRLLSNLRNIYTQQNDAPRVRNVLEFLVAITPAPELLRELESLGRSPVSLPKRSPNRALN